MCTCMTYFYLLFTVYVKHPEYSGIPPISIEFIGDQSEYYIDYENSTLEHYTEDATTGMHIPCVPKPVVLSARHLVADPHFRAGVKHDGENTYF